MIKTVHHGLHTNHISCFIRGISFGIYRIRQSPFSDFSVTFIELNQANCSIGNNLLWVWIREVWSCCNKVTITCFGKTDISIEVLERVCSITDKFYFKIKKDCGFFLVDIKNSESCSWTNGYFWYTPFDTFPFSLFLLNHSILDLESLFETILSNYHHPFFLLFSCFLCLLCFLGLTFFFSPQV